MLNIFIWLKQLNFVVYYVINLFIRPSKEVKKHSILFVRLDAIGDYILVRNFIEIIRNSEKYKNYQITLVGNIAWKKLALELDYEYIDNFIWLDRCKFSKNIIYRYQMLKKITSQGYQIALNSTYSREFYFGDNIIKLLNSEVKIGSAGDVSNIKKWQKNISDKYYNELIDVKDGIMFEFNRNKEFFEVFLDTNLIITKPSIALVKKKLSLELSKKYAVLFIGSSARFRKWEVKNFVKVGDFLRDKYDYKIVLCGGAVDMVDAKRFKDLARYEYIDLVGKTSLMDLLYIISGGGLMVSNETSAPHFAVALEAENIFIVSNGNHFGRFTPYPKDMSQEYHPIYHSNLNEYLRNYTELSKNYGNGSRLNISSVGVGQVIEKIDRVLSAKGIVSHTFH
jgi:ADP-heptose:LPS heptosyltransferase